VKREFAPSMLAICNSELDLGNSIDRLIDNPPLPLIIVFKEPIHKRELEAAKVIEPFLRWFSHGGFAGYVNESTGQSVQGPSAEGTEAVRGKLTPSLQAVYDLELSLGNLLDRIEEPAGDRCPLAVIFKRPLHKAAIESTLALPSIVEWWESRDPHYSIEGGYVCNETRHAISGPLAYDS
jgi:hypothetical protein